MSTISEAKSTTEVNLLTIKLGYFLAKSAGMLFLRKSNTVMVEQENLKNVNINRSKKNKYYLNLVDLLFQLIKKGNS